MKKRVLSLFLMALMVVSLLPVTAQAAGKATIRQVETDGDMSMAVTSQDDLYVWGADNLKRNGGYNLQEPTRVMDDVREVSGTHSRCFLKIQSNGSGYPEWLGPVVLITKTNGDLYAWGSNNGYQLGTGERVMNADRTDW